MPREKVKVKRGRRAANRDTRAGRYRAARYAYPTQSEFPRAEYVDAQGRRYCVGSGAVSAPGVKLTDEQQRQRRAAVLAVQRGDGLVRLNVLFPHGQTARERRFAQDEALDLMPLLPGLGRQQCRFSRMDPRREPNARTCAIYVFGFDHSS
jgi:hypothetical protein